MKCNENEHIHWRSCQRWRMRGRLWIGSSASFNFSFFFIIVIIIRVINTDHFDILVWFLRILSWYPIQLRHLWRRSRAVTTHLAIVLFWYWRCVDVDRRWRGIWNKIWLINYVWKALFALILLYKLYTSNYASLMYYDMHNNYMVIYTNYGHKHWTVRGSIHDLS